MGAARRAAEDEVKRLRERGQLFEPRPSTDNVPDVEPPSIPDTSDVEAPEGEEWANASTDQPET